MRCRRLSMILMAMLSAALPFLLAAPVSATNVLPDDYPQIVWPDPTPAELEILPRDGCKHLFDLKAPERDSPEFLTWQYSDDGICWDWYRRHVNQSFLLGDVPPPGTDPGLAFFYGLTDERRQAMSERREILQNLPKPAPAGSNPGPLSPRLQPVYE